MARNSTSSFERVFPRRSLFEGKARSAFIWSLLGSIALCLLLFNLLLIVDLLVSRGELILPAMEIEAITRLQGSSAEAFRTTFQGEATEPDLVFENSGLLPTVWWSREKVWGPSLAWMYRRIPWLRQNASTLVILLLSMIFIGFARSLFLSRARQLSSRVAVGIETNLRRTLHRQSLRLGPGDLFDVEDRRVLDYFTEETDKLGEGIRLWVSRLTRFPVELLLLFAFALCLHFRMTVQCLIPLGATWYVVRLERQRFETARGIAQARNDSALRLLTEGFRKTRLIRGHGMEEFEHEQFQKHLNRYSDNVSAVDRQERISRWLIRIMIVGCGGVILFLVGTRVLFAPDDLTVAAALVLAVTFAYMHAPLEALSDLPRVRQQVSQAAERIYRYLNQIPEVGQAVGAKFLQPLAKSIQFESVNYTLPNKRKLLDGVDLKLNAGEVIALVSLDPLEARAMAYMLPRFIEPQSGRIMFDGEDIAWVTLESLRAEAIYVGGNDAFFTGTVLENISCGSRDYSLPEITEASKETHAHNFILKLPHGYETIVGEHGEQLDAGQAFRLGLARAVLRNPALLIIAEPEVPLDEDTKSLLEDAYNRIAKNRTIVFLPSRLSTLRRADQIVLIHRGKVEAVGSYGALVRKSALYRHWEYVRFNEFNRQLEPVS